MMKGLELSLLLAVLLAIGASAATLQETTFLERPNRIVGGSPVAPDHDQWQVSIQKRGYHFCGGTLIARDWVLTAAHCTKVSKPKETTIQFGGTELGHLTENVPVEKIIAHERYDSLELLNDIGLMKMKMDERSFSKAVFLPLERDASFMADDCFVTGYGLTSFQGYQSATMLTATVPIMSYEECSRRFRTQGITISKHQVCAGGGKRDTCQGDSGGPLAHCDANRRSADNCRLLGITSFGIGCATPGLPGVYTKVADYVDWIEKKIEAE